MNTEKLQDVLKELRTALSKLLDVSKAKQEVLINRDHENLNALINQEQRLLADINEFSKQQKNAAAAFKSEYQVPENISSITEVLEIVDGRIDSQLRASTLEVLEDIKIISEELNTINYQNKVLIETSREFIKGIIHAVRGNSNNSIINRKM